MKRARHFTSTYIYAAANYAMRIITIDTKAKLIQTIGITIAADISTIELPNYFKR